jgi:Ion channel
VVSSPDPRDADRAVHQLLRSFRSVDSYGLVLVMIVLTYVLAVSLPMPWGASLLLFVQIATVRLVLHTSLARRPWRLVANVLFVLAGFGAIANLFTQTDEELLASVFLAGSILYVVAPFSIVRYIAFRREVDRETMLGALSAYLLFGMAFAFTYRFLAEVQGGPFFGAQGEGDVADDLFFSFVTLTTTGYGNLVPANNPGQSLAVVEALLGQLFLVTALAKLVSAWKPRAWIDPESSEP